MGSTLPDLDAMLESVFSDEDAEDADMDSWATVNLDDMLDDMFSEDEDDNDDTLHLHGIADPRERRRSCC